MQRERHADGVHGQVLPAGAGPGRIAGLYTFPFTTSLCILVLEAHVVQMFMLAFHCTTYQLDGEDWHLASWRLCGKVMLRGAVLHCAGAHTVGCWPAAAAVRGRRCRAAAWEWQPARGAGRAESAAGHSSGRQKAGEGSEGAQALLHGGGGPRSLCQPPGQQRP